MSKSSIFGKSGLIVGLAAILTAILGIWAFPQKACSLFYADNVFLATTPVLVCRTQVQWQPYASADEVTKIVQNGQLRNFGEQCYVHSECIAGGDGNPRCVPLDSSMEASPKFCLSRDKNCSFPGLPGLNSETEKVGGPYEGIFGNATYYCERETDGINTIRYFIARKQS